MGFFFVGVEILIPSQPHSCILGQEEEGMVLLLQDVLSWEAFPAEHPRGNTSEGRSGSLELKGNLPQLSSVPFPSLSSCFALITP